MKPRTASSAQLDLAEPVEGETPATGRCVCGKKLTDPVSLAYGIGPDCRQKLGIRSRQRLRLARVKPGGDCDGRGDLLEEETS